MQVEILERIGLTRSEATVYLAMLELGISTTGRIVEKSRASSSKIYEILDRLMQKGLVSFIIKNSMKYFEAASPDRILDFLSEKEQEIRKQKDAVTSVMPELKLKQELSKYRSEATIYKGMKGIKTAFYSSMEKMGKGEEILVIGKVVRTETIENFFMKYHRDRALRGIRYRAIFSESARGLPQSDSKKNPLSEIKFIPELTPASINILRDHILIFPIETGAEPIVFDINNQDVANSFRVYFERLWSQDTVIVKGMDSVVEELKRFIDNIRIGDTFDAYGTGFGIPGMQDAYARAWGMFHDYRKNRGIRARWLFQQGTSGTIRKNKKNYEMGEVKYLPYKTKAPVAMYSYDDEALILIQGREPSIIRMNNREIADAFREQFETVWQQDVTVSKGFDALKEAVYGYVDDCKSKSLTYDVLGGGFGQGRQIPIYLGFYTKLHKYRHDNSVNARMLFRSSVSTTISQNASTYGPAAGMEVRYIAASDGPPVPIFVSSDYVLFIIQDDEPTVIKISNKIVASLFRSQFELLWKS